MKVLHVSFSNKNGGASIAAWRIHSGLKKYNVESYFLSIESFTNETTEFKLVNPKRFIFRNYFHRKLSQLILTLVYQNSRTNSLGIFQSKIKEHIRFEDFDIIHYHWINGDLISIKEVFEGNHNVVWTIHDHWPAAGISHVKEKFRSNKLQLALDKFIKRQKRINWNNYEPTIICPSKWIEQEIKMSHHFKTYTSINIPNPIDMRKFISIPHKDHRNEKVIIGFGANDGLNSFHKGFDLLIDSLRNLSKTEFSNNVSLIVIGGKKNEELDLLGYQIEYTGHISDEYELIKIYSKLSFFILPSRIDNLPNMSIEVCSCEVPVLGFKTCGVVDIIKHKKNGFLAEAFSVKDLENGILWLTKNHNYCKPFCRPLVSKLFSEDIIIPRYIKVYNDVLFK